MVLAPTFALLGLLACKQEDNSIAAKDYPARMARGYCEAVYSCPCETYPYSNFNECFGELSVAYDELNDEAFLAGLTYDGSCPARELDTIDQLACKSYVPELPAGVCIPPCNAWHGPGAAGSICEVVASSPELGIGFSTCAQGLTCLSGVCVNPCQVNQLPGVGEACPDLVCEAGATCNASMICEAIPPLPGPAEPCANGLCDPKRAVCVAEANICAALPKIGQACVQGQCEPSAQCNADDVCEARLPLACGLLGLGNPGDGDGDGDPTGDGDGDPTGDGDGDGDEGDGDGDGDGEPNLCDSIPLGSLPVNVQGSTVDAPAIESGTCGGSGNEVSYTFVAPSTGYYAMSLEGSDYDTVLYVRDGDCTGSELACSDDGIGSASYLELELWAGQEVTIFVDGYSGSGYYVLNILMF